LTLTERIQSLYTIITNVITKILKIFTQEGEGGFYIFL